MGEMTIRVDDATLVALQARAEVLGRDVERVASDLLKQHLVHGGTDRTATARAILARAKPSPISSVELLDDIRNEER